MERRTQIITAAAVTTALAIGVASAAVALGGDDDEQPITGDALERAAVAALAHVGGGRVTETELGDEDSYYEVEVTLDDGSQVDVQLDREFVVVTAGADAEDDE
jgi:uncharacterized membrane protein YkoI